MTLILSAVICSFWFATSVFFSTFLGPICLLLFNCIGVSIDNATYYYLYFFLSRNCMLQNTSVPITTWNYWPQGIHHRRERLLCCKISFFRWPDLPTCPVIQSPAGPASHKQVAATFSGAPILFIGKPSANSFSKWSRVYFIILLRNGPNAKAFTVIVGPRRLARCLESLHNSHQYISTERDCY